VRSVKSRRSAGLPLKGKPGNWIAIVGESQRVVVAEGRRLSTVVGEVRKAGLKNVTYARVPHVDHTLVI
jgi:hypothetical protein